MTIHLFPFSSRIRATYAQPGYWRLETVPELIGPLVEGHPGRVASYFVILSDFIIDIPYGLWLNDRKCVYQHENAAAEHGKKIQGLI